MPVRRAVCCLPGAGERRFRRFETPGGESGRPPRAAIWPRAWRQELEAEMQTEAGRSDRLRKKPGRNERQTERGRHSGTLWKEGV